MIKRLLRYAPAWLVRENKGWQGEFLGVTVLGIFCVDRRLDYTPNGLSLTKSGLCLSVPRVGYILLSVRPLNLRLFWGYQHETYYPRAKGRYIRLVEPTWAHDWSARKIDSSILRDYAQISPLFRAIR